MIKWKTRIKTVNDQKFIPQFKFLGLVWISFHWEKCKGWSDRGWDSHYNQWGEYFTSSGAAKRFLDSYHNHTERYTGLPAKKDVIAYEEYPDD